MVKKSSYMLHKYLRRYPLTLLLAIVIVLLSLLPIPDVKMPVQVPLADKWTHMVMYGTFALVIWWEYGRSHKRRLWKSLLCWAVFAPIAFSGLMELLQAYATTYRSGEWLDLLANTIGVLIGSLIGFGLFCKRFD